MFSFVNAFIFVEMANPVHHRKTKLGKRGRGLKMIMKKKKKSILLEEPVAHASVNEQIHSHSYP